MKKREMKWEGESQGKLWGAAVRYSHIGLTIVTAILVMAGLGYLIDKKTGKYPTFTAAGGIVGTFLGLFHLFQSLLRASREG